MRGEEDAYLAKRESEKVSLRGEGAGQNSTRCEVQPKLYVHPKYYKHLKKSAHQSHLGRQKMGWFLAD